MKLDVDLAESKETPWQKRERESMELHFQLFTVLRLAAQKKKLAEKDPQGTGVEEDDDGR